MYANNMKHRDKLQWTILFPCTLMKFRNLAQQMQLGMINSKRCYSKTEDNSYGTKCYFNAANRHIAITVDVGMRLFKIALCVSMCRQR